MMKQTLQDSLSALIIDDNPDDRALILRALRKEFPDLESVEVSDSEAFHRCMEADAFEIVITDCQLNWATGLELLPDIKKMQPDCPILMFTDSGSTQIATAAISQGVEDYILKAPQNFVRLADAARMAVQKRRAGKESERLLALSKNLESIETLAGGIAHHYNNFLTTIIGYCELHLDGPTQPDSIKDMFAEIYKAADKASDVVAELLAFAQKQVLFFRPVDLNALISGLTPRIRSLHGEKAHFSTVQALNIGMIRVDPRQLAIVILRLAQNAFDAMPNGGELLLETGWSVPEKDEFPHASRVYLRFTNTGAGLGAENPSRIFEPFFATDYPYATNHFGLSTVHGIVNQNGGSILVEDGLGNGSTFTIHFPRDQPLSQGKANRPKKLDA